MTVDTDFRAELAAINAMTLAFLRKLATDDLELLRAVPGLPERDADTLKVLAPDEIVRLAQTPVLLCQPRAEFLRRIGAAPKTGGGPVIPLVAIAELVRSTSKKGGLDR